MRRPFPNLTLAICDKTEVYADGAWADDIIDCTPDGEVGHRYQAKVLHIPPTGSNAHNWAPEDLDLLVELAMTGLGQGHNVLIHCSRGVSRSTTAAAAVLLSLGLTGSVAEAVGLTRHPDRVPVKTALASLNQWWQGKQAEKQMAFSLAFNR